MAGPGAGPEAEEEVTAAELGGGVSPRVVRQDWGGRPRRVGRESGHPRPGGRGARGPVGDSGGECFREEHPPVLA